MNRNTPREGGGMTPIEDTAPYIRVKENSNASSGTSVNGNMQNNINIMTRSDSLDSIEPIITSATVIPKKSSEEKKKSKKCKYFLIALGVFFVIIVVIVLACMPLYIRKNKPGKLN